ncbi:DUF354 domain-containing protein [Halocatena halophila]|uniref:DUF354 domain-containing protein n=1 Tax=Halocatena halophila TaxID=2814576 RepID=UPI002ED38802
MHYCITIQHPAHVHFFKHAIWELREHGHEVSVFARDKEVTVELLEAADIDYELLIRGQSDGMRGLLVDQPRWEFRLLQRAREIEPDVVCAIGGTAVAHVGALIGARSVVFTDTEHAPGNTITFPFADEIWTPSCYTDDIGEKQHRYDGYHELAYLHPDRFEPDPGVFDSLDLDPDDRFVVLRVVSWEASHDIGEGGFNDVTDVVTRLESTGAKVLITAEAGVPNTLRDRQAQIPPHRMHDLLAYADCFVGEGATMAAESAVLGTPAVYVNSLRMGYTDEIEAKYGLLVNCQGAYRHQRAIDSAVSLLESDTQWEKKRAQLLEERTDTTAVILEALDGS